MGIGLAEELQSSFHDTAAGTPEHMFIQLDKFNPRLFVRDKRGSGKNINKEYDDITKVRRNNSYKSTFWSKKRGKKSIVTIFLHSSFNGSFQIFQNSVVLLEFPI